MIEPLDPRLQAVAEEVRPGRVAADVGTDHGYLICALVESGRCPRGFASDIHPMPLESAKTTIAQRGLEDRITTFLSDGLLGLPGEEIDDVILAGMGGELIGNILTAVPWTRQQDKRFLLQPMTRASHLRHFLYREGFVLLKERAVVSGRFVYTVMTVVYEGTSQEIDEVFAVGGLHLGQEDPLSRRYLEREMARLEKQAAGLARSQSGQQEAARLEQVIQGLKTGRKGDCSC